MTLILAIATFILASIAACSIWQNYRLQKRERKERLLNEIIEWAVDTTECGVEANYENWRTFTSRYFDKLYNQNIKLKIDDFIRERILNESTEMGELISSFVKMRGKNTYIRKIATKFSQDLQNAVIKLIDDFEVHIELLAKCIRGKINNIESMVEQNVHKVNKGSVKSEKYAEDIGNHKEQLNLLAQRVIEEATEIKTRDIG
ncbi:hypothetical protein ACFLV5_02890 [Chloroflexota bacterium]